MNAWDPKSLVVFLAFFIPGFISTKVWGILVPTERRDISHYVYETIGYGTLNFALLS